MRTILHLSLSLETFEQFDLLDDILDSKDLTVLIL